MTKPADLRLPEIELLTRRELSSILKIGISSLDLIPENELPRVRLGKSVRFTLESVNNYIKKHENSGGKDKC
jgi:predicted DNA-binding transcriptional regulator AlpA